MGSTSPTEPVNQIGRRERKSDKTRRRILDAAAEVLNRNGFAGARLSEIAAQAELRVPAVYYYFESREAILEEVVLIGVRLAMDNVKARLDVLPARASTLDRLCAAYGAHLEMVLKESAYTAAAMRTVGQLPADIRERQLRQQRTYGELWRGLIAAAVEAGELDPGLDPRAARMLLMGAVNWAPEWWKPSLGSLADTVATAERLVRNALTAAPPPRPPSETRQQGTSPDLTPRFAPPPAG